MVDKIALGAHPHNYDRIRWPRRPFGPATRCQGDCAVRARQRQRPAQPAQQLCRASLREDSLATLLFDLLTVEEARDRRNVFDIELLARRLLLATAWVRQEAETRDLFVGYFGASTGAAAALVLGARSRIGAASASMTSTTRWSVWLQASRWHARCRCRSPS